MFVKITHKWASGPSKPEFQWLGQDPEIEGDKLPEHIKEDIASEHRWSDKYRGFDYSLDAQPSEEWLVSEVRVTEARIRSSEKYLEALKKAKK